MDLIGAVVTAGVVVVGGGVVDLVEVVRVVAGVGGSGDSLRWSGRVAEVGAVVVVEF